MSLIKKLHSLARNFITTRMRVGSASGFGSDIVIVRVRELCSIQLNEVMTPRATRCVKYFAPKYGRMREIVYKNLLFWNVKHSTPMV